MSVREEELSYLRDELNQQGKSLGENSYQTISHILLMWGGALTLFGYSKDTQNMVISVIIFAILILPNILLYFTIKKDIRSIENVCKLASYIIVFYERKFIADKKEEHTKKEDYIFWEIANIEIKVAENNNLGNNLKHREIMIKKFSVLAIISIILILLYSIYLFFTGSLNVQDLGGLIMSIICFITFCISVCLIYKIFMSVYSLRGIYIREKIKWLRVYLDYAIKNGYYSEKEVKERFGEDFLYTINYRMPI